MRKGIVLLLLIGLSQPSCSQNKPSGENQPSKTETKMTLVHIDTDAFNALYKKADVQLIDVRTPAEYAEGHLRGSLNIDVMNNQFLEKIDDLDPSKPVYVYCRSGQRSTNAGNQFIDAGFTEVYNLKGGILAWQSEGFPVVDDE
jgi:rhodanese-related sulfurtransferase